MESFVITKDGMELQTKLVAGMTTTVFTKISVSEHRYSKDELYSLTELNDVRQTVLVSSIKRKDATQVEVIAAIENTDLDKGYDIQALGLYAEDSKGNEVLYAVSISGDHSDYMPPCTDDALSEITYRMNILVGSSEQVAIHVNPGAIPTVEQVEDIREDVDNLMEHIACNMLYIGDFTSAGSRGGASCTNGNYVCSVPDGSITVWSGEIALPEGGYAYPASSDTADVIVAYTLDGVENRVEISAGAVLPEGAVVTEYRLERKDGESRIVADVWPMISPGKRPVSEYVPYTGDGRRMNRCVALVLKAVEKLHKFCLEKFLTKEDVANNLVTTNGGWALDARQGKVLKDEINGISGNLSQICSDSMNISIPYHDATITFLRTGQFCMAYIEHHVKGENWDCGSMGIWVPRKFRPAEYAEPGNTARRIQFHANGNIGFHGKAGEDFWDYGFVAYKCTD